MKIQIIALGMTDQSHRKFYNTQDMGLGRALADMGHCVDMYSFIKGDTDETVEFAENLHMHYLHSKSFGFHSLHSCDFITPGVDGVIVFSDNQMNFKQVRKVCQKNHVVCLPYIGALGSHNTSSLKKMLLDILIPNIRYYRKMTVMAKTPNVKKQMESEQIKDVIVAPCCLDLAAVHEDYEKAEVLELDDYNQLKIEKTTDIYGYTYPYSEICPVYEVKNPAAIEKTEEIMGIWDYLVYKEHTNYYENNQIDSDLKILLVGDSFIRMFLKDDIAEGFSETLSIDWMNLPILGLCTHRQHTFL